MALRRFDSYELNLTTGELKRDGQPVALQRQPARVLAHLVGRAGALVPREDLHAAIWGPDVHVDFDRGLNYCIRQLRETLQDEAREPRFIATVPRQGYRFVAAVAHVQPERSAPPPLAHESLAVNRPLPRRRRRWAVAAALGAAAALVLAADIAAGGNGEHHRIAVAFVRAVHDAVF